MIGKTALLFPGTGAQYIGMMREWHERYAAVRETFEEAADTLGIPMAAMCFKEGFREQESIAYAQQAMLISSVAAYRVYVQQVGVKPAFMAGHSLGELSALTCAGVLRLRDAAELVRFRGEAMEAATPVGGGALAAVNGLDAAIVAAQCERLNLGGAEQAVWIACRNAADQTVIAGHQEAVSAASEALVQMGGRVVPLLSRVPFHTPLMAPAAERLREQLAQYELMRPSCPVVSNVTAEPFAMDTEAGKQAMIDGLARQLVLPVRWAESIRYMQRQGVSHAIELGPNTVLTKLVRRTARNMQAYAWDDADGHARMLELGRRQPSFIDRCLAIAVTTRNTNGDPAAYEAGVIAPYRVISRMQQELEQSGRLPSAAEVDAALASLRTILTAKGTVEAERESLLHEAASIAERV
ncbi:malonyl CoA-acyl carrier protein transacylase [Paenibacillus curdlanolyticus YK9]|uniref:[acyl-carrier-protein] S-malonyltransferase n=1 Tax=Paenibacillus curdlanolyticus YK9 TaxID=717606 RepID=E0I7S7_9BACL|nr:ACP S-malonyltransferase [Paenibacillus curdlanolyticus]EFM11232.1 malonyl CoA-acyl carrier protein transacylase [Paenibacillus curdlanolyticus YK9]